MTALEQDPRGGELREKIYEVMRGLDFTTDVPGIRYLRPDGVEYQFSDSGSSLLVRVLEGKHVRVTELSGYWSGLPESPDDEAGDDLRFFAVVYDPRLVLEHLKEVAVETDEQRSGNRILTGKVNVGELLVGQKIKEASKDNSVRARLVADPSFRLVSMDIMVADETSETGESTWAHHEFSYF